MRYSTSSFVEPDVLAELRKVDALSYLLQYEGQELKSEGANRYRLKSNHSCTVSGRGWYDFGTGEGGKSAIDFLVKMRGYSLSEACEIVGGAKIAIVPHTSQERKTGKFEMPEPNATCGRVIKYLLGRGIDKDIIMFCIENKLLYEAKDYGSAVFVGYDENDIVKYGFIRGTLDTSSFRREVDFSQKKYGFRIAKSENTILNISEAIIDGLSVATLYKLSGYDWNSQNYLPLGGVYQKGTTDDRKQLDKYPSILRYLGEYPPPEQINIWFDNDPIGREASEYLREELLQICDNVKIRLPSRGKDWNGYLVAKLQQQNQKFINESER